MAFGWPMVRAIWEASLCCHEGCCHGASSGYLQGDLPACHEPCLAPTYGGVNLECSLGTRTAPVKLGTLGFNLQKNILMHFALKNSAFLLFIGPHSPPITFLFYPTGAPFDLYLHDHCKKTLQKTILNKHKPSPKFWPLFIILILSLSSHMPSEVYLRLWSRICGTGSDVWRCGRYGCPFISAGVESVLVYKMKRKWSVQGPSKEHLTQNMLCIQHVRYLQSHVSSATQC